MNTKGLFFSPQASFALVATFFALWLAVYFDSITEDYFGYVLIITIGILHGANDLRLIGSLKSNILANTNPLIPYLLVVALTALSFYFIPGLALLFFVLLSCYHFGEQHWVGKTQPLKTVHNIFFMCYGTIIFSLLFYLNSEETVAVINNISGILIPKIIFLYSGGISFAICILIAFQSQLDKSLSTNWIEEIFLLLVFALVFTIASLIWAFAIYFIFWHSIPSLNDQVQMLYGKSDSLNIRSYLKSSWLYYVLAIIGLGATLYFLRDKEQLFLSVFFSFLAAITIPHVLVMMRIYRNPDA